jgi:GTPase
MTAKVERSGTVAIIGRSNVGKSTLLNAALDLPLAIVSRKPQTTRDRLLGVVRHENAEIGLYDTPGFHRARSRLGREMNRAARAAAREADVVVFVVALPEAPRAPLRAHPGDLALLSQLEGVPVVLVVNKIDLLRDKRLLLPLMEELARACEPAAVVPISALEADGIRLVLDEVVRFLPEGAARFDEDTITDRPLRYFAAEYVREPILKAATQEVPHATAVTIERFADEPGRDLCRIEATIHVEREGQKRILIGQHGSMLKRIGTSARQRIEELLGKQVHLELFVRVTPDWRARPDLLGDFGLLAGSDFTVPLDDLAAAAEEELESDDDDGASPRDDSSSDDEGAIEP